MFNADLTENNFRRKH